MRRGCSRLPCGGADRAARAVLFGVILLLQMPAGASQEEPVPEAQPRWRGGVLLDDEARAALRLRTDEARTRASSASDWLVRFLVALPFVLNAVLAATLLRKRRLLAAQLFLFTALALSLNGLMQGWVSRGVGRERPYLQECGHASPPTDCSRSAAAGQVSFYSGHASTAATGASLAWLYAGHAPTRVALLGWLVRGVAVVAALATGLLRILADRHYATDVIAGAVAGVALTLLVSRVMWPAPAAEPELGAPHLP